MHIGTEIVAAVDEITQAYFTVAVKYYYHPMIALMNVVFSAVSTENL